MNKFYTLLASAALVFTTGIAQAGLQKADQRLDLSPTLATKAAITTAEMSSDMLRAPQRAVTQEGNVTITTTDQGIIVGVDGVDVKKYERAGTGTTFFISNNKLTYTYQSGMVNVVEDGDNVYIQDPLTRLQTGAWVKGTKVDGKVVVPARQPLAYNSNYNATLSLRWGNYGNNLKAADDYSENIVFAIDGNTLTLEGTTSPLNGSGYLIGLYWDDDNSYQGYWDAETVLTYDESYEAPTPVELPEGAVVENWYLNGEQVSNTGVTDLINEDVKVSFVGNDVYIAGFTSEFPDSWIKGTLEGTTISFENFQYLGAYGGSVDIWCAGLNADNELDAPEAIYDAEAKVMTFTTALLANAAKDRIYYLDWIDNITISAEEVPGPSTELVELPEGVELSTWYLNGDMQTNSSSQFVKNREVKVAIAGADVYVSGISSFLPNGLVKGQINGSAVEFENYQFLGVYAGAYNMWLVGVDAEGEMTAPAATYDSEGKTLTFTTALAVNTAERRLNAQEIYSNVVLSAEAVVYEEPVLTTKTAELPYTNTFDTEAEQAEVAIYDANEDGKTFTFVSNSGSIAARYTYSTSNTADDYLVFPGLELEAGVTYGVAVEAWAGGTSYPERFEVLAGKEAKASKLDITVIPATVVNNTTAETYSNVEFTVEESGIYYFAVHCISDPDQFYLFIDNFMVIDMTPEEETITVVWDNTSMQYEAPYVHYSLDGGETFEEPIAMTAIEVNETPQYIARAEGEAGTAENPYGVADVIAMNPQTTNGPAEGQGDIWVEGYILGYITSNSMTEDNCKFTAEGAVNTNLLFGPTADCTDWTLCIPVQLPSGAVRTALNLADNAGNLGKHVTLKGDVLKYFGKPGLKNVSAYSFDGDTPEEPQEPTIGTPAGGGTAESPYNVAAAITLIKGGFAGDEEVYVTGKITTIKEISTQHGNATYLLADEGAEATVTVYRGKWFNGENFTAVDQLAVGAEVVVYGKLELFGSTYEVTGSKLYSYNGSTGDTEDPEDPQEPETPKLWQAEIPAGATHVKFSDGGDPETFSKTFEAEDNGLYTDVKEVVEPEKTEAEDVLNWEAFGFESKNTNYGYYTLTSEASGVTYKMNMAVNIEAETQVLQFNTNSSRNSGIVVTANEKNAELTKVKFEYVSGKNFGIWTSATAWTGEEGNKGFAADSYPTGNAAWATTAAEGTQVVEVTDEGVLFPALKPTAGGATYLAKITLTWKLDASSGIEGVEVDESEAAPIYFNLQGVRVLNPENGLYIEVRGNSAKKVLIK